MPKINWNDPNETSGFSGDFEEKYKTGDVVLATVAKSEQKTAGSGAEYFNLRLVDSGGSQVCWDMIMLGGNGGNVGQAKLRGLGINETTHPEGEDLLAAHLIGKTAWVKLKSETYEGKSRLKVGFEWSNEDTDPNGHWHAGYWRDADDISAPEVPGPGADDPASYGENDVPF